jgi:hypothetical protein
VQVAEALIPVSGASLFGTRSLVDSELALMLQRLARDGDPLPARVQAYADREWDRPSVREYARTRGRRRRRILHDATLQVAVDASAVHRHA